jgi:uncharacterized protein with von Willebrand factor type A (vWA) domain
MRMPRHEGGEPREGSESDPSPEILQPGGSVEYNNEEAGAERLQRFTRQFPKFVWLNPEPEGLWQYRQSISVIRQPMNNRMFPLTIEGLERGMRLLSK